MVIHKHRDATSTLSALPIMVRFFQSEANEEEHDIRVPESTGVRL
jgi:hypothetical protein